MKNHAMALLVSLKLLAGSAANDANTDNAYTETYVAREHPLFAFGEAIDILYDTDEKAKATPDADLRQASEARDKTSSRDKRDKREVRFKDAGGAP